MNSMGSRSGSGLTDVATNPVPDALPIIRLPQRGMRGVGSRDLISDQIDQRIDERRLELRMKLDRNSRLVVIGKDANRTEVIAADQCGMGRLLDHLILVADGNGDAADAFGPARAAIERIVLQANAPALARLDHA